ncbi:plasminogen-like [Magallana gigas]|uniref:plasminogen-like n=1 Tax=Magallana gigas TaxID=29159 RepID=UPI0033413C70
MWTLVAISIVVWSVYVNGIKRHLSDCVKKADGSDYTGTINKTKSGKTCQAWSSQTPHEHRFSSLPNNYCRNPDGEPGAWCYTTDPNSRWEFCEISQCKTPAPGEADECLLELKGQIYQGTKNVMKSGLKCQVWSVKTPHSHSLTRQSRELLQKP